MIKGYMHKLFLCVAFEISALCFFRWREDGAEQWEVSIAGIKIPGRGQDLPFTFKKSGNIVEVELPGG
jgi:hypothetical protein